MGKIKEYAENDTISLDDLLIGTDSVDSDETKNFKISKLIEFFSANMGIGNEIETVTSILSEGVFQVLDSAPKQVSTDLTNSTIIFLGATIKSLGGTNGTGGDVVLKISRDLAAGASATNAIATATLVQSNNDVTSAENASSFSRSDSAVMLASVNGLYLTAEDNAVSDWSGDWELNISFIRI